METKFSAFPPPPPPPPAEVTSEANSSAARSLERSEASGPDGDRRAEAAAEAEEAEKRREGTPSGLEGWRKYL